MGRKKRALVNLGDGKTVEINHPDESSISEGKRFDSGLFSKAQRAAVPQGVLPVEKR